MRQRARIKALTASLLATSCITPILVRIDVHAGGRQAIIAIYLQIPLTRLNSRSPAGERDQPTAIATLVDGIDSGLQYQTLGVTGSGKTFTMANQRTGARRL